MAKSVSTTLRRCLQIPVGTRLGVLPRRISRGDRDIPSFLFIRNMSVEAPLEETDVYRAALPFEDIPKCGGLRDLPYVGLRFHLKPFSEYPVEGIGHIIRDLHPKLGPIFRLRLGKDWIVFTDNLDDTDLVLRSEPKTPHRDPISILDIYNKRTQKPLVVLANVNGSEWKRLRTPMNIRMSRPKSVTYYLDIQQQVAKDFADRMYELQDSDPQIMAKYFFRFALESVAVICFNSKLGLLEPDSDKDIEKQNILACYYDHSRSVVEALLFKKFMFLLYEDSYYKKFKQTLEDCHKYTSKYMEKAALQIAQKEKEGTLDPTEPNFLLSLMSDKNLSDDDIFGIIHAIMTAGQDSTACGLQLMFYNLAANPDKQQKVADEVLAVLGPEGDLNALTLDKLPYMKASVQESLRIFYPVPWGPMRRLPYNAVISGYQVPEKTLVAPSSLYMSTSDKYYDDPNSFVPERWLRDDSGQRKHDISVFAYLPFGFGPRNCIGRRFALQEMYLATTKMLQKYRIGLRKDYPELKTLFSPFRRPAEPLPFTFTPRT